MAAMYVALVPVKPPSQGKSRLDLTEDVRRELAAAFALDTVAACLAASRVEQVLAATDDASFARDLSELGAVVIPDGVAMDLNGTLRQSAAEARRRWPKLTPVALTADLPCVQPQDLDAVLGALEPGEPAYVPDLEGLGTTLYCAPYERFDPRFGIGSAMAHEATGARPYDAAPARLRRDVDDLTDLEAALQLGVGPRTRERAASLVGDGPGAS
jgi:2-phospho-L-lactate/phosphoenolpyruvate guanylyltransferase